MRMLNVLFAHRIDTDEGLDMFTIESHKKKNVRWYHRILRFTLNNMGRQSEASILSLQCCLSQRCTTFSHRINRGLNESQQRGLLVIVIA